MKHYFQESVSKHGWNYSFANGYGASVIFGPYTYGGDEGFFEIAVMHGPDCKHLCYATEVTDDVIGWATFQGVAVALDQIAALPENPLCSHQAPRRELEDN